MTERDYVKHIRKIAQAYCDTLDEILASPGRRHASFERWNTVKMEMSAPLVIEMAEAWLQRHATAPEASSATQGPKN